MPLELSCGRQDRSRARYQVVRTGRQVRILRSQSYSVISSKSNPSLPATACLPASGERVSVGPRDWVYRRSSHKTASDFSQPAHACAVCEGECVDCSRDSWSDAAPWLRKGEEGGGRPRRPAGLAAFPKRHISEPKNMVLRPVAAQVMPLRHCSLTRLGKWGLTGLARPISQNPRRFALWWGRASHRGRRTGGSRLGSPSAGPEAGCAPVAGRSWAESVSSRSSARLVGCWLALVEGCPRRACWWALSHRDGVLFSPWSALPPRSPLLPPSSPLLPSSLRRTRALLCPAGLLRGAPWSMSSAQRAPSQVGTPSSAPLWCCRAAPAWTGVAVQPGAPAGLGARNSMECRRGGDL